MHAAPSSMLSLKYALERSMAEICVLRSDAGSRTCGARPSMSVLATEMIILSDSSGGVGAKIASSPGCWILRATNSARMFGSTSSSYVHPSHRDGRFARLPPRIVHGLLDPETLCLEEVKLLLARCPHQHGVKDLARQVVAEDRLVIDLITNTWSPKPIWRAGATSRFSMPDSSMPTNPSRHLP